MNTYSRIICLVAILGVECLVLKQKLDDPAGNVPFNWQKIVQGKNVSIANRNSRPGTEVIAEHPKLINAILGLNKTQLEHEISLSKLHNAALELPNAGTDPNSSPAPPSGDSGSGNNNCQECVGCTNCKDCIKCVNCRNCVGCYNCKDCDGCLNFKESSGSTNGQDCIKCDNCLNCVGCYNCKDCTGCTNCKESHDSTDCRDCIKCIKCRDCAGCPGCAGCVCGKYEELVNLQETLPSVETVISEIPKVIIGETELDKNQMEHQIFLSKQGETDFQLPSSVGL